MTWPRNCDADNPAAVYLETHVQFGYDPGRAVVAIRKAPEDVWRAAG